MALPKDNSALHRRNGIKKTENKKVEDVKESAKMVELPDGADPKPSEITCFLLADNPFVLSGFREYCECSFSECSKSVFHIHNDTMNVWTHLVGAMWAMYAMYITLTSPQTINAPFMDKAMFVAFFIFTSVCFIASSSYHVYRSHSIVMYKLFLTFDVGSIAVQLFGSVTLIAYFELRCFPHLRDIWLTSLVISFMFIVVSVPYLLKYRRTSLRTLLLVSFSLSGLAAHFHRAYLQNFEWTAKDHETLYYLSLTYIFSGLGLVIRRTKVPEYFFPGKFDIWLSSHQIFHTLVVLGPWSLYHGYSRFLTADAVC